MRLNDPELFSLQVQEWAASVLVDEDLGALSPNIRVQQQYHMESLAHLICMRLRVPAKVLQDDTVIAEWPRGLWDYIKRAVGLKYVKEQLRVHESLVFPNVALPPLGKLGENIRLAVQHRITTIDPFYRYEEE